MKIKGLYCATYNLAMRFLKKIVSKKLARASFLGAGFYILLPTPDGVFIHPLFGSLLSHTFSMSFKQGIIISIVVYTSIGIILCLIGGGKQICHKLKKRFARIHQIIDNSTCSTQIDSIYEAQEDKIALSLS